MNLKPSEPETVLSFDQQLLIELDALVKKADALRDEKTRTMAVTKLREAIAAIDSPTELIEEKSLGRIGYEAYGAKSNGKSLVSGKPLPTWEHVGTLIQSAWESAASEIALHFNIRRVKLEKSCAPDW